MNEPVSHDPQSPRAVVERAYAHLLRLDADGYVAEFAEDGAMEFPFAPDGMPSVVRGRAALHAMYVAAFGRLRDAGRRILSLHYSAVHECADREVVVIELEMEGEWPAKDLHYRLPYVHVARVRDGKIVTLRDYFGVKSVEHMRLSGAVPAPQG
jgi:ketosteroid isomerase-like protein